MPQQPPIFRGDDANAFGQSWLSIEAVIPEEWVIAKAAFKVGSLPVMEFLNPEFPLEISLSASQTAMLKDVNTAYLAIYDEQGRKQTCEGQLTFKTRAEVVK